MKKIILIFAFFVAFVASSQVKTGVEVLRDMEFAPLKGKKVGLITNPTGIDKNCKNGYNRKKGTGGIRIWN